MSAKALWQIVLLGALWSCSGRTPRSTEHIASTAAASRKGPSNSGDTPIGESAPFPPRWSARVGIDSLDELDARIGRSEVDGFGTLSKGAATADPKSCRAWLELHKQGYEPATAVDEQPNGFAKIRCGTLALLQHVTPAKRSNVRDLALDEHVLAVLPATFASAWSREEVQAVADASQLGQSLKTFNPNARASFNTDTKEFEVVEVPGQPSSLIIAIEAWGDFNGDGDDDAAMSVINLSGGTVIRVRLLLLTRREPNAVLHVLTVD
jgi:hypothetical protein